MLAMTPANIVAEQTARPIRCRRHRFRIIVRISDSAL
jgi:hypothetical protein